MSTLKTPGRGKAVHSDLTLHMDGLIPDSVRDTLREAVLPAQEFTRLLSDYYAALSLAPAMAASPTAASPQMARSLQARENWLRSIEDEFGTYSRQEVAELRGSKGKNRGMAAEMQEKGQIIAFRRGNAYRVPAFQFDAAGQVIPAIPRIIAVARNSGWEDQDILVWLTNPNTHFPEGRRPVDCLDDADRVVGVLAATIEED